MELYPRVLGVDHIITVSIQIDLNNHISGISVFHGALVSN